MIVDVRPALTGVKIRTRDIKMVGTIRVDWEIISTDEARKLAQLIDQTAIQVMRSRGDIGIHKAEYDKGDDIA